MTSLDQLVARAEAWMSDDPDPATRAELQSLVDARDEATLESRLGSRLAFGTAGLRGELGAGSARMNRKVVLQTTAGFAAYLWERHRDGDRDADGVPPSCVIGFDARERSDVFAEDAASVLAGAGIAVTLLTGPCPTPLLAFAVRHLDVCAGVMITASHNPPRDNGYKVYLGGPDAGSQIAPPVDARIAALIEAAAAAPLSAIPRAASFARDGASVREAYVAATVADLRQGAGSQRSGSSVSTSASASSSASTSSNEASPGTPLRVVYTAMHGVGLSLTREVLTRAGLPELISVPEQETPDGLFPTVSFPNPEEPGALDLAMALAEREHADLIVAHDPDADRLAVALPIGTSQSTGSSIPTNECAHCVHTEHSAHTQPSEHAQKTNYVRLTGNQLGLLLGWECAERATAAGIQHGSLAATIVSSPALLAVAEQYGFTFVQTLSGFKWVSRVTDLIFGFEEALGYLVNPRVIRDKDGISAAALALSIAERLHRDGKTLWDRLDEASARFGHFASDQVVLRLESAAAVEALSMSIRREPPTQFDEVAVAAFTDFTSEEQLFGGMPVAANVLRFDLADGSRVMIRPSGTEPKLKVYLDAHSAEGSVAHRTHTAEARVAALTEAARGLLRNGGELS